MDKPRFRPNPQESAQMGRSQPDRYPILPENPDSRWTLSENCNSYRAAYWISDAFNAATWQFASSIIAVGLTYREALGIVALSFFIMSFVIAGNGAVGAIYHVPFPVIARASWGFWGSYLAIVSRVVLAVFWFAIQNVNGGNAVRIMLGAIWPSFLSLQNGIPASEGITTNGMVGFLIFWLVQLPFLCLHPDRLRWLFVVKSVLVPIAWIAILIWAFVAEKGGGGIFDQQTASVSGSRYSWLFLANMTSVLGNYATLSVNQVGLETRTVALMQEANTTPV
ncbi:hypothetical protein NUU61_007504 [Penicillium alfredii]|uniref:Allantoin permease n=1 Tax=Penicillium alfredii TaxID=1506179 RepID=A0A9W9F303_9EURO|nr:uncharacterized protein NUU61_007504 [Penicillium alfredii]KAJ5092634.1 hypothetical protein NUU61_007504 [Penicillium alfredii]